MSADADDDGIDVIHDNLGDRSLCTVQPIGRNEAQKRRKKDVQNRVAADGSELQASSEPGSVNEAAGVSSQSRNLVENTAVCSPVVSEQSVNATGQLCTLCPQSNEKYEGSPTLQKETHVFQHMALQGLSMDPNNPAPFYESVAELWKRCFPPVSQPPLNVAVEISMPSSSRRVAKHGPEYPTNSRDKEISSVIPKSHVIKKAKPMKTKTHELCFVCGDLVQISSMAKQVHVWEEHMDQSERFVCRGCGNKGSTKTSLERACVDLHPEIPVDIQELAVQTQTYSRQYDLCFPRRPVGRPPRLSATGTASVSVKATPQASSSGTSSTTSRRSLKRRYSTRNLRSTTPKVKLELEPCVASAKTGIGRRLRSLDGQTSQAQRASRNIKTSSNLRSGANKKESRAVINENECQLCFEHLSPCALRASEGKSKATYQRRHALTEHFAGPQKLFECSVCGSETVQKRTAPSTSKAHFRSNVGKSVTKKWFVVKPKVECGPKVACRLCGTQISEINTKLSKHALRAHLQATKNLYECSKCGFGHKETRCIVVDHIKAQHPGDATVGVINRCQKFAEKIQACYDACFPGMRMSAATKGCRSYGPITTAAADAAVEGIGATGLPSISATHTRAASSRTKVISKRERNNPAAKIVSCQLCDKPFATHNNQSLTRHAMAVHFQHAQKVFECSKCGFSHNALLSAVVNHAKQEHPDDVTVRVLNRTQKLAEKIQACYDACFPNEGLSVARKVCVQRTLLVRKSNASEDPGCAGPSTSGQGNVSGRKKA